MDKIIKQVGALSDLRSAQKSLGVSLNYKQKVRRIKNFFSFRMIDFYFMVLVTFNFKIKYDASS